MPTYDYLCDHCGHRFAAVQSFQDAALSVCPNCGAAPRRLINAPAVVFKGSGWYKTDSRTPPPDPSAPAATPVAATTTAAPSGGAAASGTTEGGAAKTDAKPSGGADAKATTGAAKPAPSTAPVEQKADKAEKAKPAA